MVHKPFINFAQLEMLNLFVGSGVIAYKDKDYHLFTGYMVANVNSVIIPHVAP